MRAGEAVEVDALVRAASYQAQADLLRELAVMLRAGMTISAEKLDQKATAIEEMLAGAGEPL